MGIFPYGSFIAKQVIMLRNHLKIAARQLIRNKGYAAITISGIAMGLAAFWIIALYVGDELRYDRFHENADRIVRVVQHARWGDNDLHIASSSAPFAPALKVEFPEIEEAVRILPEGGGIVNFKDKKITANDIFFADKNIFSVFTFPFLSGDPGTALAAPESIVITESLAKKFFASADQAINQIIYFENNFPNKITGVIKDIPGNSHLQFSALRSLPANYEGEWQQFNVYTYLLLKKGADYKQLENKLPAFAQRSIQKLMGINDYKIELQPLTSIHLHSNLEFEISPNGSISRVYVFSAIALVILLIAVINYVNLSTARATIRVREVGVRKAIGSGEKQLAGMFMTEALLQVCISAVIGIILVVLLLPVFNELTDKALSIGQLGLLPTLMGLGAFAIFIGIISGIYPAFFISRFRTIPALKGQAGNLSGSILFRQSLVVFQFMVTAAMIVGSIVIYEQLQYTSGKNLGFNRHHVLTFHIHDRNVREQVAAIKTELKQNILIRNVAVAGNPIGNNDIGKLGYTFENEDGSFTAGTVMCQELMVDEDYIPTMEIKMLMGRNFSGTSSNDKKQSAIVNEFLVRKLGWTQPIGKKISSVNDQGTAGERTVIGVVKDFHTYSLQHAIEPLVMIMPRVADMQDNLYVKINTDRTQEALAYLESAYKKFDSSNPVEFQFLDQNFARQYVAEQKQEQLSLVFTGLAIFIACLGLFGLAAFITRQRIKEIGIRKVHGASVGGVVALLSKDFIRLVLLSILIATPVAWYTMHRWLQNFAYRIELQWWMFALAGLLAMLIALLTVSFQSVKAALANPVKSLRSE